MVMKVMTKKKAMSEKERAEKQPRQVLIKNLMKRSLMVKIAKLKEAFY